MVAPSAISPICRSKGSPNVTTRQLLIPPILLGAVLNATGNTSPMTVPAKARCMTTKSQRWAARYGVAFKPNPHGFMSNTVRLMRGAVAAQRNGYFSLYHRPNLRGRMGRSVAKIIGKRRRAGDSLMAEIESQEVKDRLRQNTERAVERGAFGAPTFFVGSEMFWAMIASASSRRHWASWCEPA
jgi:2-hydroxychromene-2-carboxylate isomerase